ncbi:hypothetical protein LCGC14_2093470, partial [marine sediment metagenome]
GVATVRAGIAESAEARAARLVGGVESQGFRQQAQAARQVGDIAFDFANDIAAADERIRTRDDTVDRARKASAFNEAGSTELRRVQTEGDLSKPEILEGYSDFLDRQMAGLVESHQGSAESLARLTVRLEGMRSTFADRAAGMFVQGQRDLIASIHTEGLNTLRATAHTSPGLLPRLFDTLDARIDDMAPALTPQEESAFRNNGREQITEAAIGSFISRGQIDEAERILLDVPGVRAIMGQEAQRRVFNRLRAARMEQAKQRAPIILSPGQTAFDPRTGRPIATLPSSNENVFGSGVTGNVLGMMADMSPAFANGQLSPAQERDFIIAVQHYRQASQFQNPDTGLLETRRNEVPEFVTDAFAARGLSLPGFTEDVEPTEVAEGDMLPSGPGGQTVFELAGAGLVTGPIPAIGEAVGRTPGLGGPAPEMTRARNFVPLLQRDLVRVLQNNPRYAEGERKAIEAEINIAPRFFDDPAAFQQRLIGIDDALEIRLRNALKTASSEKVGSQERTHAMNVANALQQFRSNLLPTKFEKEEDAVEFALSAPPGTKFTVFDEAQKAWIIKSIPADRFEEFREAFEKKSKP